MWDMQAPGTVTRNRCVGAMSQGSLALTQRPTETSGICQATSRKPERARHRGRRRVSRGSCRDVSRRGVGGGKDVRDALHTKMTDGSSRTVRVRDPAASESKLWSVVYWPSIHHLVNT